MTRTPSRLRALLAIAAAALAALAVPAFASAALTVTGATLDGATSVSSPPGGVLPAKVTTRISSPTSTWRSTAQRIGSGTTCVNTGNTSGAGSHSATYDLAAPGAPGTYDVGFTAARG